MSQEDNINIVDPFGTWRMLGEANMNTWAKAMADAMSMDVFRQAMESYLDTYLAASASFHNALDQYMNSVLPQFSPPSRQEVINLGERITDLARQYDDLGAKTEQRLQALPEQLHGIEQQLSGLDMKTEQRLHALSQRVNSIEQQLHDLDTKTEQRLNDLDGGFDQIRRSLAEQLAQPASSASEQNATISELETRLQALDDKIAQLLQLVGSTKSRQQSSKPANTTRRRKSDSPEQPS